MYNKKVISYFTKPKNVGVISNADGVGKVKSSICGDYMDFYIKVKKDKITQAKFKTYGCAASIATSAILTEMVKGKTLQQAGKITKTQIVKKLGGLPLVKVHCAAMAVDALKAAIKDYRRKHG